MEKDLLMEEVMRTLEKSCEAQDRYSDALDILAEENNFLSNCIVDKYWGLYTTERRSFNEQIKGYIYSIDNLKKELDKYKRLLNTMNCETSQLEHDGKKINTIVDALYGLSDDSLDVVLEIVCNLTKQQ